MLFRFWPVVVINLIWKATIVKMEDSNTRTTSITHSDRCNNQLPIIYVTSDAKNKYLIANDSVCPICLAPVTYQNQHLSYIAYNWLMNPADENLTLDVAQDDDLIATTCGHALHHGCLQSWLRISPYCPVCRKSQRPEQCIILRARTARKPIDHISGVFLSECF